MPSRQPSASSDGFDTGNAANKQHEIEAVASEAKTSPHNEILNLPDTAKLIEPDTTAVHFNGSAKGVKSVEELDQAEKSSYELATVRQNSNESEKSRRSSHDGEKLRKNSNDGEKLSKSSSKTDKTPEKFAEVSATSTEKPANDKPKSSKSKKADNKSEIDKSSEHAKIAKHSTDKKVEKQRYNDHPMEIAQKSVNDVIKPSKPAIGTLRSAAARPVSARPSAPRRRDRNIRQILHTENFVQESGDQSKAVKNNVLPEFDEEENVVITNAIEENIPQFGETPPSASSNELNNKQGHLVQQILETQSAILKADGQNEVTQVRLLARK